jgi:RimJ/RimL family protein N-acetyltransferase
VNLALPAAPLRDGVVALRGFGDHDLPAIVAACQDPEIPRWTTVPSPYGEREALGWLSTHGPSIAAGRELPLAIVDAGSGALVGSTGLSDVDAANRMAEVGYWVAAEGRGRGVATRAVGLLASFAFDEVGIERLELLAHPDNHASQRVAERAGFTREGLLRSGRVVKGRRIDLWLFSLLPGDPRP